MSHLLLGILTMICTDSCAKKNLWPLRKSTYGLYQLMQAPKIYDLIKTSSTLTPYSARWDFQTSSKYSTSFLTMLTIQKEFLMAFMTFQPIIAFILILYTPKSSFYRPLNVFCIAILSYAYSGIKQEINGSALLYQILGAGSTVALLQIVNLLLILKIDSKELDRALQIHKGSASRTSFALRLIFDWRAIGTAWQPSNIACFPPYFDSNCPSRLRFLAVYCSVFAWKFLFLDFIITEFGPLGSGTVNSHYQSELCFLSLDASNMAWTHRFLATLVMWPMLHLALDLGFLLISLFHVGLGLSEPEIWPPLFGRIQDAYTIRKFWKYALHL